MRTIIAVVLLVSLAIAVGAPAQECPKNTAETAKQTSTVSQVGNCVAQQPCSVTQENCCSDAACDATSDACCCKQPTQSTAQVLSPETHEHLLKAQEHLRAAGLHQLASQLNAHSQKLALTQQLADKVRQLSKLHDEINQLRGKIGDTAIQQAGPPQVAVELKIIEVSRSKLEKLGLDWTAAKSDQASCFECVTSGASGQDHQIVFGKVNDGKLWAGGLKSLCARGLAKVLAAPCVVTMSGRPATFSTGGEVPVPVPTKDNKFAVELLHFGTRVDLVPVVEDDDQIRLELRAEVKQLDETKTSRVGGFSVPAIRAGRVDTAVKIGSGHTIAVAGLVHARPTQNCQTASTPGNEPTEREEVELIVLATPRIVGTLETQAIPHRTPVARTKTLPSPPMANSDGGDAASRR